MTGLPYKMDVDGEEGACSFKVDKDKLRGRVCYGGHPVLRWMMDNVYVRTDPAGNIKIDKEKSREKIDGAACHGNGARESYQMRE